MSEATLPVPNAILFILDPKNGAAQVPEYTSGVLAVATSTCASVATRADVDGDVTVRLLDWGGGELPAGFSLAFDGILETPAKTVAIVTSHFERVLEQNVSGVKARVLVGVDDAVSPVTVVVQVKS